VPIYTCTVAESTLSADTKRALAGEIARIHSSIVHVPTTYVNVAFHELAAAYCPSQVMSRPGSPEVEGERYRAMPERLPRRRDGRIAPFTVTSLRRRRLRALRLRAS
jgi:phenylpyruvate tautomerase PptA (4-oxalocrotonate tautomerase family)